MDQHSTPTASLPTTPPTTPELNPDTAVYATNVSETTANEYEVIASIEKVEKQKEEVEKQEEKQDNTQDKQDKQEEESSDCESECDSECDSDCSCNLEDIMCPMCLCVLRISIGADSFDCPMCKMHVDINDISDSDSDSDSDDEPDKEVSDCPGFVMYSLKMLTIVYLIKLILYLFERDGQCNCVCPTMTQTPWGQYTHFRP
jgi:hypothetical protein